MQFLSSYLLRTYILNFLFQILIIFNSTFLSQQSTLLKQHGLIVVLSKNKKMTILQTFRAGLFGLHKVAPTPQSDIKLIVL